MAAPERSRAISQGQRFGFNAVVCSAWVTALKSPIMRLFSRRSWSNAGSRVFSFAWYVGRRKTPLALAG